ncbi:MAG: UDP-N-acetylglucosamine 2-epimerase (non-hydrolyzing) [Cyanobacteria bacterium P01_F01_bin.42]
MSNALKVCITLGTRPEAIKLAPVIKTFQRQNDIETKVILTGQHREMVAQVMDLFEIEAHQDLGIMKPKQSLTEITCGSLRGLESLFAELAPDIVLVQGDTTTAFAAGLAAFYEHIAIGHVEAGLRTNNILNPFPEEANRRLLSQISTLHFAPTEQAVQNLRASGVTGKVFQTGNTVIDALLTVAESQPPCDIPGLNWNNRTILATVHRRENWGQPLEAIARGFLEILNRFDDVSLVLPLHRNPVVREPLQKLLRQHPRAFLTEPLDYRELVGAIQRCTLLLTDSGGLQEEAPSLGKPVLVLRDNTERPEAIAAGTARLIGTDTESVVNNTQALLMDVDLYQNMANAINPFGDGTASAQILEIVRSHFDDVDATANA